VNTSLSAQVWHEFSRDENMTCEYSSVCKLFHAAGLLTAKPLWVYFVHKFASKTLWMCCTDLSYL